MSGSDAKKLPSWSKLFSLTGYITLSLVPNKYDNVDSIGDIYLDLLIKAINICLIYPPPSQIREHFLFNLNHIVVKTSVAVVIPIIKVLIIVSVTESADHCICYIKVLIIVSVTESGRRRWTCDGPLQ